MLTLAVAQIEATMTDGDKSVAELTNSFTYIASKLKDIVSNVNEDGGDTQSATIQEMKLSAQDVHQRVVNATIAFQFYDRLTQRIDHVKRDLGWLGELINDPAQVYNPNSWKKLQQDIATNYSMDEERIMFEHIMNGASVEEALQVYQHHFDAKDATSDDGENGDEVELF